MDASITKSASLSDSPFSESNKNSNYQSKSKKTKKKKKNIDYVSDSNSYTNKSQVSKEDDENDDESKSVNNTKPKGKTVRSSSQHYSDGDTKKVQSDLHDSSLSISSFSVSSSKYEEKKKSSKKTKQEKNTTNNKKKNKNKGKKKKYKNSYSRSSSKSYTDSFSSDVSDLKRKGNNKKRKKSLSVSSNSYMRYDKYDSKKKKSNKNKDEYKKKSDKKKSKKKNDYDKLSSISLSSFYSDVTSYSDKYEATSKGKSKKKDKNKKSEKNTKLEKREKVTDKDKYYDTRKRYSDSYTTSIDSLKSVSFEKKKKKSEKKYDKKKYNRGGYSSSDDTQNEGRGYRDRYFRNRDIREDKKYEKKRKYGERDKYGKKYKNDNKNLINKYGKRKYSASRSLSYSNRYSIESKNYKGKRRSFSSDILDRSDISPYYSRRGGIKKIRKKKNLNNMNIITSSHSFSDNSINYRFKRDASQEIFWKKNRNVYRYNDNISIKYEGKKKNYERAHNYNNTSFEMLGVQLRRNKNYNENEDKIFGMTKYDSNNNISNRTNDIIGIINREKTCPFLLRLFYKTNVEYISVDDIDLNKSGVNNNELQIYAWIDITMREIVTLVKDFYKEGRKRNAQWIFNGYSCETKKINFLSKVHSIKHNYKEDNKTLLSLNYEIGDIILLSIMFDT